MIHSSSDWESSTKDGFSSFGKAIVCSGLWLHFSGCLAFLRIVRNDFADEI